ncbi:winged helix-turn-helix domain-containing protein [Alisedimentitalea sp. MJ-SS2]|nr:winged helix-turn-helix domain-containing protein [Alisedimentitalea sp. MJ-SS2]
MDKDAAPDRIRLGDAIYHVATDRLIGAAGDEILLRWQSAQVLRYLAARLGRLVPRDDLIAEIWPDVSVTDDSLTQCIADIRRGLGDHDHVLLKTLRKRGYILNGQAIHVPPAVPAVPDPKAMAEAPASFQPATHSETAPEAPVAAGAESAVGARLDPRDVLPTLAVMPLRRLPQGDNDPLGIFAADEISGALGRAEDVNIISRLSTGNLRGRDGDLRDMGRTLNADFVLSGYLANDGTNAIMSVELAETENRFVLWSDRMKLRVGTLLEQTDWVERIVHHIHNAIMVNEIRRVRSRPVENLKLFSVLHGAIGLMHRFSPKEFNAARDYLEFVASRAPNSPAPLAWLGRWHVLRTVQGWTEDPGREARDALSFTSRALDLDPDNSLALVCEGQVLAHLAHRLDEAEERYETALISNPNDAQGRALRGMLAAFRDDGAKGTRNTERALHLTPLDPHRYFYLVLAAAANLSAGDYSRAVTLAKESLRLNRTHVSTLRTLAAAQAGAGDGESARKTAGELMRLQPELRVSKWLKSTPSADYEVGRRFADLLRSAGVPD